MRNWLRTIFAFGILVGMGGCALTPPGTSAEKARVTEAGKPYAEENFAKRNLPELPAEPSWREVLHRALLANGDLEAKYHEWAAAMQRVSMASSYPNSNVQVGFETMFSPGNMKAWDRTTVSVGFDPAMTLKFPGKVTQAGKVALAEAQTAGQRFEAAKFELQKKVLEAYLDYALLAEKVRIQKETAGLYELITRTAADRVRAGGPQQDLLKAQIESRMAQNELASMESELGQMRAMLNGMLARPADAELRPPRALPEPRALPADDAQLIAVAVEKNPELGALAREVAGRKDALKLAKMAYIPDISPTAGFTGSVSQFAGAMLMLPTAIPMIEGQIKETRSMLRASEAMLRQTERDRAAAFVAALAALRNAERVGQLYATAFWPQSREVLSSARQAYAAGQVSFGELIDAQRTLLQVRQVMAEVRVAREKRMAELEALAGVDFETLGKGDLTQRHRGTEGAQR